jgi:hypothetical protein
MSEAQDVVGRYTMEASKVTAKAVLELIKWVILTGTFPVRETVKQNRETYRAVQLDKRREQARLRREVRKVGEKNVKVFQTENKEVDTQIETVEKEDLRSLRAELNKHKVDFAVQKASDNKFYIYFKATDAHVMEEAFKKTLATFDEKDKGKAAPKKEQEIQKDQKTQEAVKGKQTPAKEVLEAPLKEKTETIEPSFTKSKKEPPNTLKARIEKAKKEAKAFNENIKQEKSFMQEKSKSMKGMEK